MNEILDSSFPLLHAQALVKALMRQGITFDQATDILDVPKLPFNEGGMSQRVSAEQYINACKKVNSFAGDNLFCLKIGSGLRLMDYNLWSNYLSQNSTLRGVGETYMQMTKFFGDFGKPYWLDIDDSHQAIAFKVLPENINQSAEVFELRVSVLVEYVRVLTDFAYPDLVAKVCFQHEPKALVALYEKELKCPVEFNQPFNGLVFSREYLNKPLFTPDEQLKAVLFSKIQGALAAGSNELSDRISEIIRKSLPSPANQSYVASQLGTSISSIKRHLANKGTTYQQVVDKTKSDLAKKMLVETKKTIEEIAEELAFSSLSSFSQAFRRIQGVSPSVYRRENRARKVEL